MNSTAEIIKSSLGFYRAMVDLGKNHHESNIYKGRELTHYTNLNGLLGIVESNGFWMSDHRFLNDVEEYNNGLTLLEKLIEKILQEDEYKNFKKVLESLMTSIKSDDTTHYICSFSTNKDCLNQWKGYAHNDDGIAIIFYNDVVDMITDGHFNIQSAYYPRQAIYAKSEKNKILLKIIQKYAKEYNKDLENHEGENYSDLGWSSHILMSLKDELIKFKNEAFEAESEIRLTLTHNQISRCKLKHRVSNGRIIPYVNSSELYKEDLIGKKLPIKEIIVGPISNQEVTCESIKVFLQNMDYSDIIVRKSSVPYRG